MAATDIVDPVREFLAADSHPLLIDGERVPAADGRTFDTPDPSTGERHVGVTCGPVSIVSGADREFERPPCRSSSTGVRTTDGRCAVLRCAHGALAQGARSRSESPSVPSARHCPVSAPNCDESRQANCPIRAEGQP